MVLLALTIAVVQLAAAFFLAVRAIARVNAAGRFGIGSGGFYAQLAVATAYAVASMICFFSIPAVFRAVRSFSG
jgi:hypothetical protein